MFCFKVKFLKSIWKFHWSKILVQRHGFLAIFPFDWTKTTSTVKTSLKWKSEKLNKRKSFNNILWVWFILVRKRSKSFQFDIFLQCLKVHKAELKSCTKVSDKSALKCIHHKIFVFYKRQVEEIWLTLYSFALYWHIKAIVQLFPNRIARSTFLA